MATELTEETLQDLYAWIDKIPLSRPKRNIARDFGDGVMAAELVKHFYPKMVDLHNYTPANSTQQKLSNWTILNRKVFSKFNFHIPEECVRKIACSTPGSIEPVLCTLRERMEAGPKEIAQEERQNLEYYQISNGKQHAELIQMPATPLYVKPTPGGQEEKQKMSSGPITAQNSQMDQTLRWLVEEKDRDLLALQETVEILQVKVSRLEHLLQLKNLRIEDLTRHVERYKKRANKK
ncbi:sperm flagellar protein 1 [Brienomyrus brachyistius]|uniref:sperm flagellar protein 1 n=1 Tax=Brienomyrus brachyistius TaxID=42636 RepID=UPI0020B2DFED|nr:sperm flagellar protein 1 [Brienomyrus brachyistius]